ncbi:hypothetical protein CO057_02600 [Candidatus Uhrbacteria bacterium CG_4_9_14_0_2_um_filter_41_50]|uniref:Uncharacterized protein n=1 Tax=Candidatus Uhrbacteria bacterium CG_4_9_14_0_2_um_filter_41_50 TaxID=1975031 RepID=A0A2M8ENY1_9BACT|nr:MAG: hypothetical protein COZ45_00235 [Candidatus Uhrbacteria bacterium CG_4_10_14_3_um_filter_41_21]PIZ55335.1 MAG: hypothetical protein COY24_00705 [Candidatus Uhrbacteria bacterium CG_4_10_14_0_2_um_filter_41_21]PJB84558.1 MAG: hypothetical protein CO086_02880 [Candidatus Uhrbacteria bacterium CG_4_9_14_0_8_um_filter_41_16]PJC24462.1 MAG: hypothetical protein CO057_02600 [Candidatus Uhrbacteria bacterium CG_4_9_14_0_2_um_filter_41_50]PJE75412.1 MAG: hypothetical protein COV03_00175 [Candi
MSTERILQLAGAVENSNLDLMHESGEDTIEVSVPASTAAALYEKVRTTLEYQEEHLLRRNAISRILRRLLGSDVPLENMAESLLTELVWAKYLPNKQIPTRFIDTLAPIFMKYGALFEAVDSTSDREYAFQWILDVLSTEVEYTLMSHENEELMASFMYEQLRTRIDWDPKLGYHEEEKDLRLFIAIHQMLLKSNRSTLRYRTLILYYSAWSGPASASLIAELANNLEKIIATVDFQIDHPLTHQLEIKVRRKAGVFRTLLDVIEAEGYLEFQKLVLNEPDLLGRAVWKQLKSRTKLFRVRLRRTAVRAVMFLFITKMFLALILEVPYDYFVHGEIFLMPLAINIAFPPILLAFISMTAVIPERRNAEDYKSAIRAIIVGANHDYLNFRMKKPGAGTWTKIFGVFYAILFFFVFGVIAAGLNQFGFNIFSILLFIFFLSLVTFFGIRIRTSTKDVVLSPSRAGIVGTIFDILVLPIVRAGQWLSIKVAKINVFIYFFDFIIESPYKVAIKFMEEWFAFVKEKKEEI